MDSIIDENGEIHTFDKGQLDDIQPGILLYPLLDKTGDQRYQKALDTLLPIIRDFPRNKDGGFWHKEGCCLLYTSTQWSPSSNRMSGGQKL